MQPIWLISSPKKAWWCFPLLKAKSPQNYDESPKTGRFCPFEENSPDMFAIILGMFFFSIGTSGWLMRLMSHFHHFMKVNGTPPSNSSSFLRLPFRLHPALTAVAGNRKWYGILWYFNIINYIGMSLSTIIRYVAINYRYVTINYRYFTINYRVFNML